MSTRKMSKRIPLAERKAREMTAGVTNTTFVVGKLKDPNRKVPTISKELMEKARKEVETCLKK